ncbi:MCE family protein [Mumia sp. zg.B53]|uniref:MCE family protein n=1 Tax=unclassified Mumia TaxID=2621872 RepID=UPI001C6EFB53|nr:MULTISPECIES: MCE family protein [unclassified Mumia]MBW9204654.1 MCE family protein [Mumia sp. zg.B17]MBW9213950.1 MCE family protein [Mumia sp. zg.B53]MDD9349857.1 MCE family protein [Mumia sp.]
MSADVTRAPRVSRRVVEGVAAVLVLALVAALVVILLPRSEKQTATVDFDRTVSLYEGSTVRILGVDVGTVESITPRGSTVRVKISWDADYAVPADVTAVIVSPSVVGDRFVQLTPAYAGGPKLADGAHLDQERSATPTELDESYEALDRVAKALGPQGANADGALSTLLETSADNLDGRGEEIRRSIAALAKVTTTADGSKDELFSSMEKIERFVSALEQNDASVRSFNSSLADVSTVLAGERDDLQAALRELAAALGTVQSYVAENRASLRKNVDGLADVTESLADQRKNLAALLDRGPKALSNLATAYNPTTGTLDTRATILRKDDGRYRTLTEAVYVGAYCGLASNQNPKYRTTCYALSDQLVWWLADQARRTSSDGAASPAAEPPAPGDAGGADASDDAGLVALMGVA